jgi:hypothetical protein
MQEEARDDLSVIRIKGDSTFTIKMKMPTPELELETTQKYDWT